MHEHDGIPRVNGRPPKPDKTVVFDLKTCSPMDYLALWEQDYLDLPPILTGFPCNL